MLAGDTFQIWSRQGCCLKPGSESNTLPAREEKPEHVWPLGPNDQALV